MTNDQLKKAVALFSTGEVEKLNAEEKEKIGKRSSMNRL